MAGRLAENDVHVWYCFCDDPTVVAQNTAFLALLTADEVARYEQFAFEKDRRLFLVARTLLRTSLSRYADVEPAAWRFEQTAKGKLFLPIDPAIPPLTFNISHSGQMAVCAVTLDQEIGVDIESTARRTDPKVARYFLSPEEMSIFQQAHGSARRELFYRYWTLKEAFAKALGMGLSLRFTEFSFLLHQDAPPTLAPGASAACSDSNWYFHQRAIAPHYRLAVAVNGPADHRPLFSIHCAPPRLELP